MNSDIRDVFKFRINGELLSKFTGKEVIILGRVLKVYPDGRKLDLEASDGERIIISMKRPLDEQLSGIIEVHGTAQSSNTVLCDFYIAFPTEMTHKFEMETYNQVLKVAYVVPNPLTVGNE